jgi:protein TonB
MALSISAEDRIYLRSQWRLNRRRFALFLLACLVVHVAILAFLVLMQDRLTLVEPEVIPIEIVQEPDQPQEEVKPEEQKPEEQKEEDEKEPEPQPQQQLSEEPATDAARAPEKQADEIRRERLAPEVQLQPKLEVAQPEKPAEPTPPLEENLKEALPQQAPEAPPMPQQPEKSFAEKFGTFQPVPDMDFEAAAPRTPMAGQAANSYNATLYGMIVPLVKIPPRPPGNNPYRGQIAFTVDGNGKLVQVALMQPSGIPELDASAVAAVRKAAPFPRPPGGQPLHLYFSYAPR